MHSFTCGQLLLGDRTLVYQLSAEKHIVCILYRLADFLPANCAWVHVKRQLKMRKEKTHFVLV